MILTDHSDTATVKFMKDNSEATNRPSPLRSINALRTLARALHELQHIDTPSLRLTDEIVGEPGDENRIQTEQDEAFHSAWTTICDDVLRGFGMGDPKLKSTMFVDIPAYERYEAATVPGSSLGTTPIRLSVRYYATGKMTTSAKYSLGQTDEPTRIFYEGEIEEYDPIEAGEHIANASITCLVMHGLTAPEALDYWQTDEGGDYSQVAWGKERGVTHQTVAQNAAKARAKLDKLED